ncbi:PREDICTED: ATP-binding cassette sub-family F member 2-like [Elephantulus edwardii]|uniref:ATP-binding cassette sub-family F member 2-like n=1 Tax=Elephantulus edwardii TaxID=28737 RepID=UPI0003F0C752|nr:PREDICTED: ATP-binding cassette sub-family F member 2-like [Elephantulus edwardii]
MFLARLIPRMCHNINRVVYIFGPPVKEPPTDVTPTFLTTGVLSTLRQADFEAHNILRRCGYAGEISQMPVILSLLHFDQDPLQKQPSCQRSVVIRTFITSDFMTGVPATPGSEIPVEFKCLTGELLPTDGMIQIHSHVKIGRYHQHLQEQLDLDLSRLEYRMKCYPEIKEKEEMRKSIGQYGLTGKQQVSPIGNLSDGQKCCVCLAWLAWQNPHLLFLDEHTNHLDIETTDALADAINEFEGGMMLVSHDFRLIRQVAQEIWVCEKQTITKWPGDILAYMGHLKSKLVDEEPQLTKRTHNV